MTNTTPAPSPDPGTTNNPDAPGDLPVRDNSDERDDEEDDEDETEDAE
jgi:hypothetical protein